MITCPDLARMAEQMGVTLRRHDGGKKGWYSDRYRAISTRRGLSIAEYRSTLAHELGHAWHRDTPTRGKYSDRQETRANRFAATLLLSESDVRAALCWHNHHRSPAAHDLEVTEKILGVWLELYERQTV